MTMAALVSSTFLVNALWVVVALILLTAVFTARLIVRPGRAHIWSTPKALGLEYEDVTFTAQDGATLVGWFLPAPAQVRRPAPVIMVVHGWPWCRMGTQAKSLLNDLPGSRPVNLLPFMKQLHEAGYHVISADHRNFGSLDWGFGFFDFRGWHRGVTLPAFVHIVRHRVFKAVSSTALGAVQPTMPPCACTISMVAALNCGK